MTGNELFLIAVALFPAVFLCVYIFKKDRAEKEPIGLLLALLGAGVAICFPTVEVCQWIEATVNSIFLPFTTEIEGVHYLDGFAFDLYTLVKNFIVIALVEEGFKWLVLVVVAKNNKNFNSIFDGIIYAVFVSLGFAGFENILYSLEYGMSTALIRMVTAVPGHMFDAVIMGYWFSWYHIKKITREREVKLKSIGAIPQNAVEFSGKRDLVFSLLMPVLAHGFYDYCCSADKWWSTIAFVVFLIFLYIFCFGRIRKMSDADMIDTRAALTMLSKKYPAVRTVIKVLVDRKHEAHVQYNIPKTPVTFEEICEIFEQVWTPEYNTDGTIRIQESSQVGQDG